MAVLAAAGGSNLPPAFQTVIALAGLLLSGGALVAVLRVGPERRKINAETVTEGANAASVLTGQAMEMVKEVREAADARVREMREDCQRRVAEADGRVKEANERRVEAERRATEEEIQHRVCEEENLAYAREIGHLVRRLAQWEDYATEGREPPPPLDGRHTDGAHG
jgi:hypothetical protein